VAWYPDSTPDGTEKWKVPSCHKCNSLHGETENVLMSRIGLCLDPTSPASAGVTEKAMRSMDPRSGKTPRDSAARAGKQKSLMEQVAYLNKQGIPDHAVYPEFGRPQHLPAEEHVAIPVPKRAIDRLAEKIVRGLTYLDNGKFIDDSYLIESHVMREESASELREQFAKFGMRYDRRPGLVVDRCVTPEDGISSMYRIEIWGQFRVYASVVQKSRRASA
jgi:hypothetical protein